MTNRKMIILGVSTDETGREWQIGIPMKDLTTHAFMFGTTGSGKSTALKNMAIQGFALGASTLILEPHGDLCLDTLSAIPNNALSKVVYLSLDSTQPPSIPLMTFGLGGGIDVGVSAVMGVLRMAEPAAWKQATQMREVLRHSIRAILDAQGWNASLISLDRFLTQGEESFQEAILPKPLRRTSKAVIIASSISSRVSRRERYLRNDEQHQGRAAQDGGLCQ